MEAGAKDYATLKNLNLRKCELVIHPDALWLGASPDGLYICEYMIHLTDLHFAWLK